MGHVTIRDLSMDSSRYIRHLIGDARRVLKLIRRLAESTVSEIDNNGNRASFSSVKTNLPYYMNQLAF